MASFFPKEQPSRVVLDDLSQTAFPCYTPCFYIYTPTTLRTPSQWADLTSNLQASYHHTHNTRFPFCSSRLFRDSSENNKLTLVDPGSTPNLIEFQEVGGWAPTERAVEVGDLSGWPVLSKLIGCSMLNEEEHVGMKIRVSWCHEWEGEGEGEGRSVVVLGGLYSHLLCDATTWTLFMNEWAAVHRKMFDCEIPSLPFPAHPPIFDPSVLVGRKEPITPTPEFCKVFVPCSEFFSGEQPKKRTLRLIFPRSVLAKMQEEGSTKEVQVSKNDVLFSLLWKACQTATPESVFTEDGVHFGGLAISVRNRYPGFTPRHCGNAVLMGTATVDDVRNKSIGELARLVRAGIEKASKEENIQPILDWVHQLPKHIPGIYSPIPLEKSFCSTQWRNLNMYDTNFGPSLGTPSLVLPPYDFNGFLITLPPCPSSPPPTCEKKLDEEQGVIAQLTLYGETEEEKEKFLGMMPEGVRLLTELNIDISL